MQKSGSRTHRRRTYNWRYWVYWNAILFAMLSALALLAHGVMKHKIAAASDASKMANRAVVHHISASESVSPVFSVEKRKLYPYSIIPGGLEEVSDLRKAMEHDPLVAAHYANFDLAQARLVRLDRDEAVYVSFRLNNQIYWTKKTLLLHRGETVITDGQHFARTRCGNRASATPQTPTTTKEPTMQAMDAAAKFPLLAGIPEFSPTPEALIPPSTEPISSGTIIPPAYFPIVGDGGNSGGPTPGPTPDPTPNPTPVTTPEPGVFAFLALGLLALGCLRLPSVSRNVSRS